MAYDFDWDGTSLALGDEEAQRFVLPEEPTGNATGVSPIGSLDGFTDFSNFGVYNGAFRKGPPDPTANITPASSTVASNFMPHWRFIQSSNTTITASQVRDTTAPSGSNLRFTFAAGSVGDAAFAEQLIDVGGTGYGDTGDSIRVNVQTSTMSTNGQVRALAQYMTVDGSIIGMPAEQSATLSPSAAGGRLFVPMKSPPENAKLLRVRVEVSKIATAGATGYIDISDVRRDSGKPYVVLPDGSTPSTKDPGKVYQAGGSIFLSPQGTTAVEVLTSPALKMGDVSSAPGAPGVSQNYLYPDLGRWYGHHGSGGSARKLLLSGQLMAIPFALNAIPVGATTELRVADSSLNAAVNRFRVPWSGSIVGLSYRLSAAVGAGTLRLDAYVDGANVWTAFSAAALAVNGHATQAPDTDSFTSANVVSIAAVGSGGLTAGLDIAAMLWVLLDYDGA